MVVIIDPFINFVAARYINEDAQWPTVDSHTVNQCKDKSVLNFRCPGNFWSGVTGPPCFLNEQASAVREGVST